MTTTKLSLYNGALRLCGERKLASVSEAREARYLLDDVYDDGAINHCLEMGLWNFAIRTVQASYSASVTPDFGFTRAFDKPTDWVRTVALCADDRFRSPLDATGYVDEAGYWFADHDILYVRYVSDDASYGSDLSLWPQTFVKFFEAYLAVHIAPKLTAVDMALIQRAYDRFLHEAKTKDAMNEGAAVPVLNSWAKARLGRSARRYDRA